MCRASWSEPARVCCRRKRPWNWRRQPAHPRRDAMSLLRAIPAALVRGRFVSSPPCTIAFSRSVFHFRANRKVARTPRRASDWKCGQPLAFLVEANGKRIYIDSGGRPSLLPPANIAPVDLAILGVALPDSRARFTEAVRRLRPRYILPSHQDNFFQPLDRGFNFGPMTDFPRVLRDYKRAQFPGRLVLLDYFRPWTLR